VLFRRRRFDADLHEELRAHLAEREAAYLRDGLGPEAARRRARLDFGNPAVIHEQSRDVWLVRWLDNIRRDLAIAVRSLGRTPAFTLAAVATFALGIGAATAMFSVAYGIAFRPLPYQHADRIVRIYESNTKTNETKQQVSQGTFQAWREGVTSIEHIALFGDSGVLYMAGDSPQPITVRRVSPAFFDVLGAAPLIGAGFKPESAYTRFTANEYVLSHAAWQRLFGGDPDINGRLFYIREDDDPIRVVGVMPKDFAFDAPVDAWRPMIVELPVARILRSWRYDNVVARLRAGRTIDELRAELDVASQRLAQEFPATSAGWTATAEPLRDAIIGGFGRASWLFLGAVAAVLLAACANVAGLLTARALGRTRETSIRVALGAGRWRLAQLWLTEAFVLAAAGATAGVGLAWWLVRLLRAAAPPGLPRVEDIAVDMPALAVALVATVSAALVCALVPLVGTRDRSLPGALSAGSARSGDTRVRRRVSTGLVALQSGAALALVVLAIVFGRSFLNLTAVDLGWRPERVLGLDVKPSMPANVRRPWFLYAQWAERLVARLEATPGIARAAITTVIPFDGRVIRAEIARGRTLVANEARWPVSLNIVSEGYRETVGLTLRRGRWFTADDRFDESVLTYAGPYPDGVAVVSESVARALWPGENPVGQQFRLPGLGRGPFQTVVGVVADVRFASVAGEPALEVFQPWLQAPTGVPRLLVRATSDAALIAPAVRAAVLAENPATGIDRVTPVESLVERATAPSRLIRNLIASLGLLALVLAAVGVFGALSMLVTAGARETAVRIALGASPSATMWSALARGLWPVCAGAAGGLLAAVLLVQGAQSLLFGFERVDAASLLTGAGVVLAVTFVACLAPALRAARTDPLNVLRAE
jgi:putative ABC transport system permease protein